LRATRQEVEQEILEILRTHEVELVVLAGYMRLLSPLLVDAYPGHIVNIHPSLLPNFPGTNAIEESFESKDHEMGITVHRVDYGMDTGPVILQRSLTRIPGESLEHAERRIHELEHQVYPEVVMNILEDIEKSKQLVHESDRRTL
jgi:phosphoribosylglycinamide formyltransferase-1